MTSKQTKTYKIGITGSPGTGKSLVLQTMQRLGVSVMDAEETAMNLLADNPQRLSIRLTEHFGNEVIDVRGRLCRKKLSAILYTDPQKKAFFDEKLNPFLREEIKRFLFSPIGSYLRAVEFEMLLETDTKHLYDEVWMVTTDPEKQINRLVERDHASIAEVRHMINTQWSQQKKADLCDRIIDNSGDVSNMENRLRAILEEIKQRVLRVGL